MKFGDVLPIRWWWKNGPESKLLNFLQVMFWCRLIWHPVTRSIYLYRNKSHSYFSFIQYIHGLIKKYSCEVVNFGVIESGSFFKLFRSTNHHWWWTCQLLFRHRRCDIVRSVISVDNWQWKCADNIECNSAVYIQQKLNILFCSFIVRAQDKSCN